MYSSLVLDVFGVYSGVFGCIWVYSGASLEARTNNASQPFYIYIPNVSKALAIKGQKDEGKKKMENLAELTLLRF
jgi:hypothetical protein